MDKFKTNMKRFKFLIIFSIVISLIFFQNFFKGRYLLASDLRDGETIFKNVCASCHVRRGLVITKGPKSLKLIDLESRGIADLKSIAKIANEGIGNMKGYKHRLNYGEDKILSEWILQEAEEGW